MATDTLIASLASVELTHGMQIKLEAINPTTGAAVSGVTCSGIAITAEPAGVQLAGGSTVTTGPFMLVPGPGA